MYKKVDRIPDFPSIEIRLLQFWEDEQIFNKLRERNKGGPKWSFLDGPITANNPMGVHHAWGRSLKDMFQRYHAMLGHELRYQNGFDCQGLWVEVEVEKELGLGSKDGILDYGVANFVEKCKSRVKKYSAIQTNQSIRLGYWMDWSNSYFTMSDENNYTIWAFLKRCHERGFVYKGFDVMPWCPRCGVGLSQMEMHEGYLQVKDPSVIIRLPIRNRSKEALLVWTTTPWTLTSNVAAAVNPEMAYLAVRQGDWTYYVGAANWENNRTKDSDGKPTGLRNLNALVADAGDVEVMGTIPGSELIGLTYDGPFDELEAQVALGGHPHPNETLADQNGRTCHRVIAWDQITGTEGTGIVHIAPGCGKEDYDLSKELGLVAIAPLDEHGRYVDGFGDLTGKHAGDVAVDVIKNLHGKGILIAKEKYPHSYPHCWRCKTPVLFRLVDEWYINMDWREEIQNVVGDITWIPDFGEERERDWLRNMRDWMISKKRYWGLALPIWVCESCESFDVIGGKSELEERAIEGWEQFDGHSPHRPWVDDVVIECKTCGGKSKRIPDVGNPWLDAGIVPFSTMRYNTDRDYWKSWFPPELVLECFPGQFRNWFYALLAMSTMMEGAAPFKTLLGHASVRDEYGEEMHKSAGNAIEFNEAAETIGAEVMRYIFAGQNPVHNLNFPDIHHTKKGQHRHLDVEVRRKLLTFWNCYSFYIQYANVDGVKPGEFDIELKKRSQLDRWIISKLQHLIEHATACFETFHIHHLIDRWERFIEDDLSNWYLRRSRRRFWKSGSDADKQAAYATLYEILLTCCQLMAPVLPFLCEEIYQNMVRSVQADAPQSVHLLEHPQYDATKVDDVLEATIGTIIRYKNLGLSLRNTANIKVRQPLGKLIVKPETPRELEALKNSDDVAILLEELNVKTLELTEDETSLVTRRFKANFATIGPKYGKLTPKIVKHVAGLDSLPDPNAAGELQLKVEGESVVLEKQDVEVLLEGPEGLTVLVDEGAFVALDTTITDALAREGFARDFVRHVQNLRKEKDFDISDRIELKYHASGDIASGLSEWTEYVKGETLALRYERVDEQELTDAKTVRIAKSPVLVSITKVE